jgi:enolase
MEVVNALTGIYKTQALSDILGRKVEKPFSTLVGDEGGYAPELQGNEEAFKLMAAAIERSGYAKEVRIAIDAAISDRYVEKTQSYDLKSEKRILSRQEWITQLKQWFDKYHVAAAEDICAETDHVGWRQAYKAVGGTMTVVGDDLTVTNLDLLKQSIARNAEEINTILIKINQNGSISGTIDVIQFALSHGISVSISHRSGETEDDLISDLAVASNLFEKKAHP